MLYHINVGYPMLDEGARIVANVKECKPSSAWAKENESTVFEMESCVANMQETCYYLTLPDAEISLVNDKIGKKFVLSYSADTLPCFLEWKSRASGDYALGLEPCMTELGDDFKYRVIMQKENKVFQLKIKVEDIVHRTGDTK